MVFDANAVPMAPRRVVESRIEVVFSPAVVWHCLVDPVLLDGWLGHVLTDGRVGSRFAVVWPLGEPHEADWFGTIDESEPLRRLTVRFDRCTRVEFDIAAVHPADPRSCAVIVRHEAFLTSPEERAVRAFWSDRLRDLSELLHGRPVDWDRAE
ncbi:SRPBCC domain-containing protein [Agreia pratensis]|uniref:Activator of Hsp90 ATPase homolog 1-like protein n=1 Tax=Agreia pratensis TaxID=150121 RepID=A0A1X7K7S4_9MICO|nr:SRPBCC domain-containing protein [Agreia pratensis]MBF4634316.1 SRPBCC domain-containing protein [Agreia pratensis]SMG36458.1 Activator of Hsp90 ATPase homolog 1-like protein [Agreia pratensis]